MLFAKINTHNNYYELGKMILTNSCNRRKDITLGWEFGSLKCRLGKEIKGKKKRNKKI